MNRDSFDKDGFLLLDSVVPPDVVAAANAGADDVMAGKYATGKRPGGLYDQMRADDPNALVKIDEAHWADDRIRDLVTHPAIGEAAAEIYGADMVQLWAVQLLYKPPGATAKQTVGWHQDDTYWRTWWEGEVFTCWASCSDVRHESGPMRFVRGSHTWGFIEGGNFFATDLDSQREGYAPNGESWEEVEAILPPGGVSFHHRRTIHGSGPNVSDAPRRSFAIHLRTERSKAISPNIHYAKAEHDTDTYPVVFKR